MESGHSEDVDKNLCLTLSSLCFPSGWPQSQAAWPSWGNVATRDSRSMGSQISNPWGKNVCRPHIPAEPQDQLCFGLAEGTNPPLTQPLFQDMKLRDWSSLVMCPSSEPMNGASLTQTRRLGQKAWGRGGPTHRKTQDGKKRDGCQADKNISCPLQLAKQLLGKKKLVVCVTPDDTPSDPNPQSSITLQ